MLPRTHTHTLQRDLLVLVNWHAYMSLLSRIVNPKRVCMKCREIHNFSIKGQENTGLCEERCISQKKKYSDHTSSTEFKHEKDTEIT